MQENHQTIQDKLAGALIGLAKTCTAHMGDATTDWVLREGLKTLAKCHYTFEGVQSENGSAFIKTASDVFSNQNASNYTMAAGVSKSGCVDEDLISGAALKPDAAENLNINHLDINIEENIEDICTQMLGQVHLEKRRVAPDCATCPNPCGNTDDYDVSHILDAPQNIQTMKTGILNQLYKLANQTKKLDEAQLKIMHKGLLLL